MHILLEKAPHDLTKTPYHRGYRYYLGATQAHGDPDPASDPELVEGGQLFMIAAPKDVR